MPSIPQSLLWISLVVLWLFVLVPMLISKRDAVRRTSDVALATRVLNSGAAARLLRRGGPAAGHRSDPEWRPEQNEYDDADDLDEDDAEDASQPRGAGVKVEAAVSVEQTGPDYLDVDVVDEDSGAVQVRDSTAAADPSCPADEQPEPVAEDEGEVDGEESQQEETPDDAGGDQYEYVDDTSGIAVADETPATVAPAASRRHRYDSHTAAAVSARKFAFRKRVLMTMALMLMGSAATAFLLVPAAWWVCGSIAALTVLYLGYLRRQTRIEERVRRRRMQRVARARLGVENAYDRELDVVPQRLRRPGAVVLEIDDEDPIFEHLDYTPYARDYGWHRDLPRAAGQ
jgi:hypothetical protein